MFFINCMKYFNTCFTVATPPAAPTPRHHYSTPTPPTSPEPGLDQSIAEEFAESKSRFWIHRFYILVTLRFLWLISAFCVCNKWQMVTICMLVPCYYFMSPPKVVTYCYGLVLCHIQKCWHILQSPNYLCPVTIWWHIVMVLFYVSSRNADIF